MPNHSPRHIIVTGGGTGIGRAIARVFVREGDQVILLGRRAEVLERAAGDLCVETPDAKVRWRRCNVSAPADVEELVGWLSAESGWPIDVLVNNAGGLDSGVVNESSLSELAESAHRLLSNNLVSTYLLCHALSPHLRRPGGRIINISSIAAVRGGGDMYSAAKAGVIGLTYSLARDLAAAGITVNAIAPGLVLDTEFFGDRMTEERLRRTVSQIPAGRPGRPADIAAAVRYLAGEEASYVTGEVHHVNGGWVFGR